MADAKYRDREWLHREYVENDRTLAEIADELGVDHTTISKWRRKLDIPKPTQTVEINCPVCGDAFTRAKSQVERTKYTNVCSRKCLYDGRSKGIIGREVIGGYDTEKNTIEKECPSCEDAFVTNASEDYKHCSRDCFLDAHSNRMAGENNPAYVDGTSREKPCDRGPHWNRIRRKVYERDDYTCQRCERKCISRAEYDGSNGDLIIQAHHIGGYDTEEGNDLDKLVTLCARCHAKVEGGAEL